VDSEAAGHEHSVTQNARRRAAAILALALAGLVLWMGNRIQASAALIETFAGSRARLAATPFWDAALAMELATNAADLALVVGEAPADRDRMAEIQRLGFRLIPAYAGLLIFLAGLARRQGRAGTALAIASTVAILAAVFFDFRENRAILDAKHWGDLGGTPLWGVGLLWAGLLAATLLLAWRVDVNEFSLHHLYKNRLVRCYLGATRRGIQEQRHAHPFTGFDRDDDVLLSSLRTRPDVEGLACAREGDKPPYVGPLPVVATALNLVKGDDLGWQERKSQSFVFTPLFSGYEFAGVSPERRQSRLAGNGFRPTRDYGYPGGGIHLGTAMAISGAAANPSMGYHSAPATAFLMTMFNVRLGWWMGNPRSEKTWKQASPTFGLTALLSELTSQTTNQSAFVSLSDGGHFENLGIYELVRRRCRFIIASDAEQDGDITFGGLGGAIRKCRTDFGVEIRIRPEALRFKDEECRKSAAHFAVGDILYPGGERGLLLYLKSSVTGDEPGDVLEYALRVKEFPHETTADQFFDESQFESYRQLGHDIAQAALGEAARGLSPEMPAREFWNGLFERLLTPQAPAVAAVPMAVTATATGTTSTTAPWDGSNRRSGHDRRKAWAGLPAQGSPPDRRGRRA
jgi:hypothetical protein